MMIKITKSEWHKWFAWYPCWLMIEELRLRNDRLRATLKMVTSKSHSTIYEI